MTKTRNLPFYRVKTLQSLNAEKYQVEKLNKKSFGKRTA